MGGGPIFFKISDPKQNDISKHCTKSQKASSKITEVIPSQNFHKCGTMHDERTNEQQQRHQSDKTYSLVEMKFRRDKKCTSKISKVIPLQSFHKCGTSTTNERTTT